MYDANRETRQASGNAFAHRRQREAVPLTLLVSLGVALFVGACGDGKAGDVTGGDAGGRGGLAGSANSEEVEIDADAVVDAAVQAASLSDEERRAALAAADLDGQMALAGLSGLVTELGGEASTRALLAEVGLRMQAELDDLPAWSSFGTQQTQSAPNLRWPGVRLQADDKASASEAFGAGWLGGSLFNATFLGTTIDRYSSGRTGIDMDASPSGEVKVTSALSDTQVLLDATAEFGLGKLSAAIQIHSKIPCPDVTGLVLINSSLNVTGQAGNAFQSARFTFELIVDVDDDAQLTGRNQLKTITETHTADSSKGYDVTDGSVDVSTTQYSDGSFGDAEGSYQGMSEREANGWMHAGLLSGMIYRDQLLPKLQQMLDAGRCVSITVEPSVGPMNLDPLTDVDLLTKPRAKISSGATTGGTVQAKFKTNAGGDILELGEKVPADATFHYVSPLDFDKTEVVTFESRSRRGTGKLDYTLTTSPHAD